MALQDPSITSCVGTLSTSTSRPTDITSIESDIAEITRLDFLFEWLWRIDGKKPRRNPVLLERVTGQCVRIPDTIVFQMGFLKAWYFSSIENGMVKRRKRKRLRRETILRHFIGADAHPQSICASFVEWSLPADRASPPVKLLWRHFTVEAFEQFMLGKEVGFSISL